MTPLSNKQYQWQTMLVMTVYIAVLLLVWPLARTVDSFALKLLFALTPMLPMLYLFVLMARRIRDSDELEQRMHLIALGIATMVVGALSLVGGFLAAAHVLSFDGSILIWVFPVMLISYGIARSVVARRYGGEMFACEGNPGIPLHLRAFFVATLMGAIAIWAYLRDDDHAWGMFLGMASVFLVIGVARVIQRWQRARVATRSDDTGAKR
ncbi:MAG: hypothetical protein M3Y93_12490 [Pseudomonadota bacterium]|nr:hypothetical protein [Pseudomonadota bacterium]